MGGKLTRKIGLEKNIKQLLPSALIVGLDTGYLRDSIMGTSKKELFPSMSCP